MPRSSTENFGILTVEPYVKFPAVLLPRLIGSVSGSIQAGAYLPS